MEMCISHDVIFTVHTLGYTFIGWSHPKLNVLWHHGAWNDDSSDLAFLIHQCLQSKPRLGHVRVVSHLTDHALSTQNPHQLLIALTLGVRDEHFLADHMARENRVLHVVLLAPLNLRWIIRCEPPTGGLVSKCTQETEAPKLSNKTSWLRLHRGKLFWLWSKLTKIVNVCYSSCLLIVRYFQPSIKLR